MKPAPPISRFLLRLALVLAVLIVPWPGLTPGYAVLFRAANQLILGSVWSGGLAFFEPLDLARFPKGTALPPNVHLADTLVRLHYLAVRGTSFTVLNSRQIGYLPTATLIALVAATPLPWSRRRWALIWGFWLVQVYIPLRVGLFILNEFSGNDPVALYFPSPFWKGVLSYVVQQIMPAGTFVVPIFAWILVTFRRADLEAWRLLPASS